MYHGAHRLPLLHRGRHLALVLATILLPLGALWLAGFLTNAPWPALSQSLGLSLGRLLLSYALSLLVGASLALLIGTSAVGKSLLPLFDVLQNIPSFALIPLFAAAFGGYGSGMIIIFAATSAVWPIMFYAAGALAGASRELADAAAIFGARGWRRVWYFLLPLAFPALVTGSIVAVSIGWEAVIGVEIIGGAGGIGAFLNSAGLSGDKGVVAISLLALLVAVFIINRLIWLPLLRFSQNYHD